MWNIDSLAAVSLLTSLASTCFATVIPSSQPITVGHPEDRLANLSTNLYSNPTADPDIQTSGQYLPGILPRNACLALMVKAMGALANLDRDTPFRGTTFRPTDPNLRGVQMSIVPVPPAAQLTTFAVVYAIYDISYKMITADRLQTSLWDMTLDGMRIALISFARAESATIKAGNQTMSRASLTTTTDSDALQITNASGMILTADDFQIAFFGTKARNVMTTPETFIPILTALKVVASYQASASVPSPFAARGVDTDSHLSIDFLPRASPPYVTYQNIIALCDAITRLILLRPEPWREIGFTMSSGTTRLGVGSLAKGGGPLPNTLVHVA